MSAQVRLAWNPTSGDDDAENNESDDGNNLDDGEHKLGLTIATDAEEVDQNDDNPEYDDECGWIDCSCPRPKLECDGCSGNFERKRDKPAERITREMHVNDVCVIRESFCLL